MEGSLLKWTNYWNGWQPRWFVLKDGLLSYYNSPNDIKNGCKRSFKISMFDIIVSRNDNTRVDLIVANDQHLYLKACDYRERQKWLIALASQKACYPNATRAQQYAFHSSSLLKAKQSELKLYCDMLVQQIHEIKSLTTDTATNEVEEEKPQKPSGNIAKISPQKMDDISSNINVTCDVLIDIVKNLIQITESPNEYVEHSKEKLHNISFSHLKDNDLHVIKNGIKKGNEFIQQKDNVNIAENGDSQCIKENGEHVEEKACACKHSRGENAATNNMMTTTEDEDGEESNDDFYETDNKLNNDDDEDESHETTQRISNGRALFVNYLEQTIVSNTKNDRKHRSTFINETNFQPVTSNILSHDIHLISSKLYVNLIDNKDTEQLRNPNKINIIISSETEQENMSKDANKSNAASGGAVVKRYSFFAEVYDNYLKEDFVENSDVPTVEFLECSKELFKILDKLGSTAFIPIKADVMGNINKLFQKYRSNEQKFTTLQAIVQSEIDEKTTTVKNSATDALLWLKRAHWFIREFICECLISDFDLGGSVHRAYSKTLKQYHNWVVRGVFNLATHSAPSRDAFIKILAIDSNDYTTNPTHFYEMLKHEIRMSLTELDKILNTINNFYAAKKLEPKIVLTKF